MPRVTIDSLVSAGAHFGHLTRRWNPKMKKFIFTEKSGIYVIDLKKTQACVEEACKAVQSIVKKGDKVLFVGTKKQAKDIIKFHAQRSGQFFMNERWLGGTLTNFNTIKKNIRKLRVLEKKEVDGTYEKITKKEILMIEKQKERLNRVLSGIMDMNKLPGALFIADTLKDTLAVQEAQKLKIPIFAIMDTNCNPDGITFPIPGNDDSYKSIEILTRTFTDAVVEVASVEEKDVEPTKKTAK